MDKPGDLPNFYIRIDKDNGDDQVDDLDTLDDLIYWLNSQQESVASAE